MSDQQLKVPTTFWVVSVILLLWNIMGVISFLAHVFITDEAIAALPPDEAAMYDQYPMWTVVIFAIAVLGGILGSIGLLARKKWARTAYLISLIAIIPQMIHNVFLTEAIEVYGLVQAIAMPILVVVFGCFALWYSTKATAKNWLT